MSIVEWCLAYWDVGVHSRKDLHGGGSCCQPELVLLVYGVWLLPLMQGRINVCSFMSLLPETHFRCDTAHHPKGVNDLFDVTINWQENTGGGRDTPMPCTPADMGGNANNPSQTTVSQAPKETTTRKTGVNDSTTPFPKATSGAFPNMPTTTHQDCSTPVTQKVKNEWHVYLAAGEDTDHNSIYTPPSHGLMTSTCRTRGIVEVTSATDQPYLTDAKQTRGKSSERSLSLKEQEEGYWFMYSIKHGGQQIQIWAYAHRKVLTFLKEHANNPHPTLDKIAPIYIGWVEKAARLYWQKKDEQKPLTRNSAQNSSDTISDFLSSAGQHTPTAVATPMATDIKPIPLPITGNIGGEIPSSIRTKNLLSIPGDPVTTAFFELNTPKRPDKTHEAFERCCAAVTRLVTNPASAPWLTSLGATVMTWTSGFWTLQADHGVTGGRSCLYMWALVGRTWLQLHGGGELRLPCCTMSIISETDNGACLQLPDLGVWGCVVVDYQTSILHVFHNYLY